VAKHVLLAECASISIRTPRISLGEVVSAESEGDTMTTSLPTKRGHRQRVVMIET
jgi:hypothetical protein